MATTFVGVGDKKIVLTDAVKSAFKKSSYDDSESFDLCALHNLDDFERETFAYHGMHCRKRKDVGEEVWRRLQSYCVNYFLIPEATDEFEVEALRRTIFGEPEKEVAVEKSVTKTPFNSWKWWTWLCIGMGLHGAVDLIIIAMRR